MNAQIVLIIWPKTIHLKIPQVSIFRRIPKSSFIHQLTVSHYWDAEPSQYTNGLCAQDLGEKVEEQKKKL